MDFYNILYYVLYIYTQGQGNIVFYCARPSPGPGPVHVYEPLLGCIPVKSGLYFVSSSDCGALTYTLIYVQVSFTSTEKGLIHP